MTTMDKSLMPDVRDDIISAKEVVLNPTTKPFPFPVLKPDNLDGEH